MESTSGKHRHCYQPITESTPHHWPLAKGSTGGAREHIQFWFGHQSSGGGQAGNERFDWTPSGGDVEGRSPPVPTGISHEVRHAIHFAEFATLRAQLCEGARRLPAWIDKGKVLKRSLPRNGRCLGAGAMPLCCTLRLHDRVTDLQPRSSVLVGAPQRSHEVGG